MKANLSRSDTPSILVVCTGNLCRSPYIERRLQSELDRSWGAGAVRVRSAGTQAQPGDPMEAQTRRRLEDAGGSSAGFTSKRVSRDLVAEASLVVTATRRHRSRAAQLHPPALRTTHALRDLAQLARIVPLPQPGPDPSAAAWFTAVTTAVTAQRGRVTPLPPDDADIVDPIGRPGPVFDRMAAEIEEALEPLLRILRRPG